MSKQKTGGQAVERMRDGVCPDRNDVLQSSIYHAENWTINCRLDVWILLAIMATHAMAQSNIDPNHKHAWGENIGWTNWQHDVLNPGDGVAATATHLAGFGWTESIGWINLGDGSGPYLNDLADASSFGVNVELETGDLWGMAWGENIGWINFDTRTTQGPHGQQARLDICENRFRGFAWAENVGWINLDADQHFVALGTDCAPGDVACDGTVALPDYAAFEALLMGPEVPVDCLSFDSDGDGDLDLFDFASHQLAFTD